MRKKIIIVFCGLVVLFLLGFVGLYYYQSTHFNRHVTINNVKVGGLTAQKATEELKQAVSKNIVYVGKKQIYDGDDTKMGFTDKDMVGVQKLLKKQRTIWPSSKFKNYTLDPSEADHAQSSAIKKELEDTLQSLNKSLTAPMDAEVQLKDGKIVVSESKNGNQYDIKRLLKEYEKQKYSSEVHLNPIYLLPVKADSPLIKEEKKKLEDLADQKVDYILQNKPYTFKGNEIIQSASVSKDMKVSIKVDFNAIKNKLEELNRTKATLNKNYTFKTHTGSVITVKGESYGWAINTDEEAKRIQQAFEKGESTVKAYNIYGVGWNVNGIGYHTTTNNGIGDTYVEVSIKDQRMWVYKNGQLKVTTRVVTGRHDTNEDTPKGVWYIMYKESPSVLEGSEVGNPNYSVHVDYWAPFTMSGCGLHDASWRKNWAPNAYLTQGSGGCVNTPPSVMKTVYDNVEQYEPVVVY
ncbi:MAG: L,D-transpeptidase family protein [Tuberibacillus sp.]